MNDLPDFGIQLDLASGGNTPFGLAAGYDPYKRGTARNHAEHCRDVVRRMKAPLAWLDVGKFHVAGQAPGQFYGDGLLRMRVQKVPYALEFEEAFAPLLSDVPTLVYTGQTGGMWRDAYSMFPGARWIAQDASGTLRGTAQAELLAANQNVPTLVEGPANTDTEGDKLLCFGAVMTTQEWWNIDRLLKHDGIKACLCNNTKMPQWYDPDLYEYPFEGDGQRPGWGPNWAAYCRSQGVVPVFPAYAEAGLVKADAFRTTQKTPLHAGS